VNAPATPAAPAAPAAAPAAGRTSAVRSGPASNAVRRGVRLAAVLAAVVVAYAILAAVFARDDGEGYLDTTSPRPGGTRALAQLLRDRGTAVDAVAGVGDALMPAAPTTTVVVYPGRLNPGDLDALAAAVRAGDDVVLIGPDFSVLDAAGVALAQEPEVAPDVRDPDCDLVEARAAGSARVGGGHAYAAAGAAGGAVTTCYPVRGAGATLAVLPAPPAPDGGGAAGPVNPPEGRFVVLTGATFMTNRHLGEEGNAALALGLLSRHPQVSWLTPAAATPDAVSGGGLFDLLGPTFWTVCAQLAVGLVLLALWRGRRLGPPVAEPLPVVVRAAETVEGRGRLYAAAHARDRCAAALRAGAAARLADKLGLPVRIGPGSAGYGTGAGAGVGGGPEPGALVASVAEHTGRSPMEIGALLYGSDMTHPATAQSAFPPSGRPNSAHMQAPVGVARPDPEDAALLRLALDLDALDRQVGTR
jgi:hypothetical protein